MLPYLPQIPLLAHSTKHQFLESAQNTDLLQLMFRLASNTPYSPLSSGRGSVIRLAEIRPTIYHTIIIIASTLGTNMTAKITATPTGTCRYRLMTPATFITLLRYSVIYYLRIRWTIFDHTKSCAGIPHVLMSPEKLFKSQSPFNFMGAGFHIIHLPFSSLNRPSISTLPSTAPINPSVCWRNWRHTRSYK